MVVGLFTYVQIALVSAVLNTIPALVPPTWLVLSLYKINRPEINIILLAIFGVIGSTIGRYIMYRYSHFLSRFIPRKHTNNLKYFRKFVGTNRPELLLGTFLYALSPLPSNFLFIAFGLSEVSIVPVLVGFVLGRFLSYYWLIFASFKSISYLSFLGDENVRIMADVVGIIFAILVIFIQWKKVYLREKKFENRLKKSLLTLIGR